MDKKINDISIVALDLETSGKYPIDSQICEIAAVKLVGGKEIDSYQTLVKPDFPMSKEVIAIHNITNEMVAEAPKVADVLPKFRDFIEGSVCVAHHAPFDLGFLSYDFERLKLSLPSHPVICTSLLARARVKNIVNHKLQTLLKYYSIDPGSAHRALDDARACAAVLHKCFDTFSGTILLQNILEAQGGALNWLDYSMLNLKNNQVFEKLIKAVENKSNISIIYGGGSKPGQARPVNPVSVVRNPEGDYLVASDYKSEKLKRYYLHKISEVTQ